MNVGDCIHHNGSYKNKMCSAGVIYSDIYGERTKGWLFRLPCTASRRASRRARELGSISDVGKCELLKPATADEAEEWLQKGKDISARITKIRSAIMENVNKEIDCCGSLTCLHCGSQVNYRYAACNGHVHAACTGGCASWME